MSFGEQNAAFGADCGFAVFLADPAAQIDAAIAARRPRLLLGGGFGVGLALLARHGLFRIVALFPLQDAGGVEKA